MGFIDGLFGRFRARADRVAGERDDVDASLERSLARQHELLRQVRRAVADVAVAKRRIGIGAARLAERVAALDERARSAVAAGREDIARGAIRHKQVLQAELDALDAQVVQVQADQDKLHLVEQRLTAKVESFRTQRDTVAAQYRAAEAQVRIGEAVTGISEEMADVGLSLEQVRERAEAMQARAGAIEELIAAGALTDATDEDALLGRPLEGVGGPAAVESELAALRSSLGAGGDAGRARPRDGARATGR